MASEDQNSTTECIVCYELYDEKVEPHMLSSCGHTFCNDCIKQFGHVFRCPICKKDSHSCSKNYLAIELLKIINQSEFKKLEARLRDLADRDIKKEQKEKLKHLDEQMANIQDTINRDVAEKLVIIEKKVAKKTAEMYEKFNKEKQNLINELTKLRTERDKYETEFKILVKERVRISTEEIMKEKLKLEKERDIICREIMRYRNDANRIREIISELINRRNDLQREVDEVLKKKKLTNSHFV